MIFKFIPLISRYTYIYMRDSNWPESVSFEMNRDFYDTILRIIRVIFVMLLAEFCIFFFFFLLFFTFFSSYPSKIKNPTFVIFPETKSKKNLNLNANNKKLECPLTINIMQHEYCFARGRDRNLRNTRIPSSDVHQTSSRTF